MTTNDVLLPNQVPSNESIFAPLLHSILQSHSLVDCKQNVPSQHSTNNKVNDIAPLNRNNVFFFSGIKFLFDVLSPPLLTGLLFVLPKHCHMISLILKHHVAATIIESCNSAGNEWTAPYTCSSFPSSTLIPDNIASWPWPSSCLSLTCSIINPNGSTWFKHMSQRFMIGFRYAVACILVETGLSSSVMLATLNLPSMLDRQFEVALEVPLNSMRNV